VLSVFPVGIIYGKSFQPDQLSVTLGLLALYSMMRWTDSEKIRFFILSTLLLVIASLTKLTTLALLCATVAIIFLKRKRIGYCVLHGLLVGAGMVPWVVYVYNYNRGVRQQIEELIARYSARGLPLPYITSAFSLDSWLSFDRLLSYEYYKEFFSMISGEVLTPIGVTLFLLGVFLKKEKRDEGIFSLWLLSSFLPFILLNKKFAPHWFLLPLPVLAYFIAKALYELKPLVHTIRSAMVYRMGLGGVIALCIWGYANSGFLVPPGVRNIIRIAQLVKEKTVPHELVGTDASRYLIYYADRKGYLIWQLRREGTPGEDATALCIKEIKMLKDEGVKYLIISKVNEYESNPLLKEYMQNNCRLIGEEKDICLIYEL
jgi:hypothetical protein